MFSNKLHNKYIDVYVLRYGNACVIYCRYCYSCSINTQI